MPSLYTFSNYSNIEEKQIYTIYLITNIVNNKKYVGITSKTAEERFNDHLKYGKNNTRNTILYSAIRKYGECSFKLDILETNIPLNQGEERERYYIKANNSYYKNKMGYNMTLGGNGTVGYKFTDEARLKISIAGTGRTFSEERNLKIKNAMKGRILTQKWRDKISKARLGKFTGKDNPFFGRHHSDESKLKIGAAKYARPIEQYTLDGEYVQTFQTLMLAGKWVIENIKPSTKLGTCKSFISVGCSPKNNKTCYGYRWKYKERSID